MTARAPASDELRAEFLLDPAVAFLNHGSFGACPRPVFERYQAYQRELECEPVDFLARRLPDLLAAVRSELARYVHASPADLAFVPNATTGVNLAARSLDLRAGDEVLTTDLEYGACDLAWEWICHRTGARYVRAPIPLPLDDASALVGALFAAATEHTRVLYVSHVTSATALVLPVEDIVARARALGLVTIVDGAHARPRTFRSTSTGSAPTSTRRMPTSGSAPRKARAFSTSGPSTRSASTRRSSAGATSPGRRSRRGSRRRGRAIPRPGSRFPTRSPSRKSGAGTPSVTAVARSHARPAPSSALSSAASRSPRTRCSPRWRPCASPVRHPSSPTGSLRSTRSRSRSADPKTTSSASQPRATQAATTSTAC